MSYIVDTDVFIHAKNDHYGFDFCPAFWDWIIQANQKGQVFSIDQVRKEILLGKDELAQWAKKLNKVFFLEPDQKVFIALQEINEWVNSKSYENAGVEEFLKSGDYYLIGHALAGNHTVVTHEKRSNSKKRIKIPNVCLGVGVECASPFEMLRTLQACFVLQQFDI